MAKQKSIVEETKERIKELTESKAAELLSIQVSITEAKTKKEAANLAIKAATENTDIEAYDKAKADRRKAESEIEMYSARYNMLKNKELVSEEESDRTIDELLSYEEEIAAKFEFDIQEPLKEIKRILEEYNQEVKDTEITIESWTKCIHANYRSATALYANGTNRADTPQEVHKVAYTGGTACDLVNHAFSFCEELINEEE